ncbi:MAG TPA: hypothetical protein VM534_06900 [Thermoanaerobaculia bacterium]|nr:hypothetical protein [Thermoanaerobaculia bacterium]
MKDLGIEIIVMRNNLRPLRLAGLAKGRIYNSFGSSLITSAHVLGKRLGVFYVPGAGAYRELIPDGAHPLTDPLFSTETTRIIHDGAEATRAEKAIALAEWPETFDRLRVCFNRKWQNVDTAGAKVVNCCRCEKCLRTMITLEICSALSRYSTFPYPLERSRIRRSVLRTDMTCHFAEQNLRLARERGRGEIARDLRWSLARNRLARLLRR